MERVSIAKKTTVGQSKRFLVGECCICTEDIFDDHPIWFCEQCNISIHLDCIRSWLGNRVEKDHPLIWNCPICRNEVPRKPEFRCYCGKVTNPRKALDRRRPTSTAGGYCYSCGNSCGRARAEQKLCSHRCVDRCHPGACKPCTATVSRTCFCAKTQDTIRCSMLDTRSSFPLNFACSCVCGKLKNCNKHSCDMSCHSGLCETCTIVIGVASCFSHKTTRSVLCGESMDAFSCEEQCNKLLPCGNHRCEEICHQGECSPCATDVNAVTHCGCGRTELSELVVGRRKSCVEPVPVCDRSCDRVLKCGSATQPHSCASQCHTGPCPPCTHPMEVNCRCGSKLFKTTCQYVNNNNSTTLETTFRCNRRCKVMKKCHRHRCDSICCDIPPSHHLCLRQCGAKLECGKHTCTKSCHPKGLCGKCDHYENARIECVCGGVSIPPPVLCGSKIPMCDQLCPKQQPCGHPQTHMCHLASVDCSRCYYPMEKYCSCGKVKQNNVPCFEDSVTCSLVCGKVLPCSTADYPHYCSRACHSGDCLKLPDAKSNLYFLTNPNRHYTWLSGSQQLKCTQLCVVPRPCGHPCNLPCHQLSKCPSTKCAQEVLVSCACGELIEKRLCHTLAAVDKVSPNETTPIATPPPTQQLLQLECNEKCRLILRNKKLAEALNLDAVSHYKGFYSYAANSTDSSEYSEFLLNSKNNYKLIVVAVEELFAKAINRTKGQTAEELENKYKLPPAIFTQERSSVWKRIVHEYSEHFGCYYHYHSGCYITIVTVKNLSKAPQKLLSAVALYSG